eukprot:gb/GECH01013004.1/.p1 GENE.gb/GECH01013004.1/~~gb/GECH01013004.1/.p1  ORF type:complete len:692 (+),score=124.47 gb/GECH01013004.1/:1-2076(+)
MPTTLSKSTTSSGIFGVVKQALSLNTLTSPKYRKHVAIALLLSLLSGGAAVVVFKYIKRWFGKNNSKKQDLERSDNKEQKKSGTNSKKKRQKIDGKFFSKLGEILKITIPSFKSREFLVMVCLAITTIITTYVDNETQLTVSYGLEYLINQDYSNYKDFMVKITVLVIVSAFLEPSTKFLVDRLSLDWRKRLTKLLHKLYLSNMAYYRSVSLDKFFENPDQIITQDVEQYCEVAADIFYHTVAPVANLCLYTYKSFRVGGKFAPIMVFLYMGLATFAVQRYASPFAKLAAEKQSMEGNFRYCHTRIRMFAESIAFYNGDKKEQSVTEQFFTKLAKHTDYIIKKSFSFGILNDFMSKYFPHTVVWLILAYPALFGHMKSYNQGDFIRELKYLSVIVSAQLQALASLLHLYRRFKELAGYTDRVHSMISGLRVYQGDSKKRRELTEVKFDNENPPDPEFGTYEGKIEAGQDIKFDKVSIYTPTGVCLAKNLTFSVSPGKNTLITGPNGAGKSSLFRILGGLWPLHKGTLIKPGGRGQGLFQEIYYVPQKPYNVNGTLREQIIYPNQTSVDQPSDSELTEILELVDMGYLADREGYNVVKNWTEALSIGEQQRLAMARLFYHAPRFAILDECTSAVSVDYEEKLYRICRDKGITCITISHRPAMIAYHDYILLFFGNKKWEFKPIKHTDEKREE